VSVCEMTKLAKKARNEKWSNPTEGLNAQLEKPASRALRRHVNSLPVPGCSGTSLNLRANVETRRSL
jgi:hypothetical protein